MKHSINLFIVLATVSLFAYGCKSSDSYSHINTEEMLSSGWNELKAGNAFKVIIPPDFRYEPAQGKDSFGGSFISPRIELRFLYGRYPGYIRYPENLKNVNDFKNENTTINGIEAIIQTYSENADKQHFYYIGIYFPSVPGSNGDRLAISSKVKNINDRELVRNIFETISFL